MRGVGLTAAPARNHDIVRSRIEGRPARPFRVAEFFAGVGLVRMALEQHRCQVVFANDIDRVKASFYAGNSMGSQFVRRDVRHVRGTDVPDVELITASFPCTDLSLAGNRAGLRGRESGLLWQVIRILREMGPRRPPVVMLENVIGFANSNDGRDLRATILNLNKLGYRCDMLVLDARRFTPQSRQRLFIIGSRIPISDGSAWLASDTRPAWISDFMTKNRDLLIQAPPLPPLPPADGGGTLASVVERIPKTSALWWETPRLRRFVKSLSKIQAERFKWLKFQGRMTWATAYRRTRHGAPVWEIRADRISGCLRTTRGGSSKQALVEAGRGTARVRWMTAREYARLQGAAALKFGAATENQARFALGDAVCVPVVAWLARHYLVPLLEGALGKRAALHG